MRLFVSIKPPVETLEYLENCIAQLAQVNKRLPIKWSDRSLLHCTVIFLGEVEEGRIEKVDEILVKHARLVRPFFIDISAPALLFKNQRPSVIYMKIFDQSGSLQRLHKGLTDDLSKFLELDKKKYMPHISLGRVKGGIPGRKKVSIDTGHIDSVFPVDSVELVESVLTPIGPVYTTLKTIALRNDNTV